LHPIVKYLPHVWQISSFVNYERCLTFFWTVVILCTAGIIWIVKPSACNANINHEFGLMLLLLYHTNYNRFQLSLYSMSSHRIFWSLFETCIVKCSLMQRSHCGRPQYWHIVLLTAILWGHSLLIVISCPPSSFQMKCYHLHHRIHQTWYGGIADYLSHPYNSFFVKKSP